MSDLKNRVALVTGGSRGIGEAIAIALAKAGAAVAVNYRERGQEAAAVVENIQRNGGRAAAIAADVSLAGAVRGMISDVESRLGPIDILVNNAGIAVTRGLDEITEEDFDRTVAVNLKSAFLCTQGVLAGMRGRRWGRIVNISSIAARGAGSISVAYNASKAGLINLTRCLALDHAKDKIRVNAVCPGIIADTTMAAKLPEGPGGLALWNSRIPMRRTGLAVEVAQVMLFVASDLASYMSGSVIVVDGGLTAHTGMPTPDDFAAAASS